MDLLVFLIDLISLWCTWWSQDEQTFFLLYHVSSR